MPDLPEIILLSPAMTSPFHQLILTDYPVNKLVCYLLGLYQPLPQQMIVVNIDYNDGKIICNKQPGCG
jgi:hypothetical protein